MDTETLASRSGEIMELILLLSLSQTIVHPCFSCHSSVFVALLHSLSTIMLPSKCLLFSNGTKKTNGKNPIDGSTVPIEIGNMF